MKSLLDIYSMNYNFSITILSQLKVRQELDIIKQTAIISQKSQNQSW